MSKIYRFLPLLIIIVLVLLALRLGVTHYLNFATLKNYHTEIDMYIQNNYLLTLTLFALCYILLVVTSIPGATFFTLLGGVFFGSIVGTVTVVLSATIGATLLVLAIKLAFGEAVAKRIGAKVQFMEGNFKQNAFFYLLSMRFLPIVPFFLLNLACGIFNINLRTFFFATLLGIIPGSFVYVNIGSNLSAAIRASQDNFSVSSFITPNIIIAFCLLAVLSILPVIIKKIKAK